MAKEETFSWKSTVRTNILFLKLLGLWPHGDSSYQLNYYGFYVLFCFVGLSLGHNISQVVNLYYLLDDLKAFTSLMFVTLSTVGTQLKCYSLIMNMKNLKEIFTTISGEIFQPRNGQQEEMIRPSIKLWTTMYISYCLCGAQTTFFWSFNPILDNTFKDHRLPFFAWYPYDATVSPYFELTYIYQFVAIWYLVLASMNIDCLIAALHMFIGAQCDILCDDLRNLNSEELKVKTKLISCITHHRAILRLATISNKFYNWIVLFQFFNTGVSLGISMFQLTVVVPMTSEFFSFTFYVASMVTELFIYCWFGNEVEMKSSEIPYAVFESDWTGSPLEIQKNVVIFIIRAQRPIKMSALNLFYLSLDTFKAILRTAWSYFTVLKQASVN